MSASPVVWICGPPGVGKSTVGWQLFTRWAAQGRTVGYLDIDQLAMRSPPDPAPDAATDTKAANLAAVLPNYRAAGAERILVAGVATPAEVPVFEEAVGSLRWARLTADRTEVHCRLLHRDGPGVRLPEVDRHADDLDASTFAELVIDTSGTTPIEVAKQLDDLDPVPKPDNSPGPPTAQPSGPRPPRRRGQGDARVLLLTGPRAVGTSTIGWELFVRSPADEPTAFVDLAQIGFLNAGPDLRARHHRLRAANLAAMVEVYAERGCRRIIAGGAVLSTAERDLYASSLGATPLSVVRLTATPDRLQQRVIARTAPTGGPHLAGDDLGGRSDDAVKKVLDQACRQAQQLDRFDLADQVIDTTHLSAEQAAKAVLGFPTPFR